MLLNPSVDVFVPWSKDGVVRERYCHVYEPGELETLVAESGGLVVEAVWHDTGNWGVLAKASEHHNT